MDRVTCQILLFSSTRFEWILEVLGNDDARRDCSREPRKTRTGLEASEKRPSDKVGARGEQCYPCPAESSGTRTARIRKKRKDGPSRLKAHGTQKSRPGARERVEGRPPAKLAGLAVLPPPPP